MLLICASLQEHSKIKCVCKPLSNALVNAVEWEAILLCPQWLLRHQVFILFQNGQS